MDSAELQPGQLRVEHGIIDIDATVATNRVRISVANGRRKVFSGLKPGNTYYFYFFYVNAEGSGLLSKYQSIIADFN